MTPRCLKGILQMSDLSREKFQDFWKSTEVIREYQRMLYTFGDMKLPYVFVSESGRFRDKAVVLRGVIFFRKPKILLPGQTGPEFLEGFEHANAIPADAIHLIRSMGLPYSRVSNKTVAEEQIEHGTLQSVLDRFSRLLDEQEDGETGLIKGLVGGADISLMRYSIMLAAKSGEGNVREFMDHQRRQRGDPIGPNERLSDEDFRRLFE